MMHGPINISFQFFYLHLSICIHDVIINYIILYHLYALNLLPPSCNEGQILGKATDSEINYNINCVLHPLTHKATNLCVKMQVT